MSDSPIEKIHIQEFLSLVEGLEVIDFGRQSPPEPDFWAETNFGLIGIEHTRLFKKVDQNGINPVEEQSLAKRILDEAKRKYEDSSDVKVQVNVSFKSFFSGKQSDESGLTLKKLNRTELANKLAQFILNVTPMVQEMADFRNPEPQTNHLFLPEIFEVVGIWKMESLSESFFELRETSTLPLISGGSIFLEILSSKNRKPEKYRRKYDQIWLLMVTDSFNQPMAFNYSKSEMPSISSPFDKVFIYRHGDQKYHELQKGSR